LEIKDWLLESENPSARYLALSELLDCLPDDPEVISARAAIPGVDPARSILDAQFVGSDTGREPTGYWVKPDVGYSPKYRATVWQIIFLAQLGAPPVEPIRRACEYVLNHSRRFPERTYGLADRRSKRDGRFVAGKGAQTAINCLNGNLLWALGRLGYKDDPRVVEAREATAQAIVRRGFACYYNGSLPCAWGDVKALRAFLEVLPGERSAPVEAAIEQGVDLLLSVPLLEATYPTPSRVSNRWFKLGFPLAYQADVLEAMTVLAKAGRGVHPHVQAGTEWLLARQDDAGRWPLEQVPGKMWASFGQVGQPNKWVTLRALTLLKAVS
jgi:hypothetical protein